MSKKCYICWQPNPYPLNKVCSHECLKHYEDQRGKPLISKTPVKKVSNKKKERLESDWGELQLFRDIWNSRPRICEVCWKTVHTFDPSWFAHIIAKSKDPSKRLDPNNIALVHGIWELKDVTTWETYSCHQELDKIVNDWKRQGIDYILKLNR